MRVKIICDGDPTTGRMTDMLGNEIHGITKLVWTIVPGEFATAVATFENVAVEVEGDLED